MKREIILSKLVLAIIMLLITSCIIFPEPEPEPRSQNYEWEIHTLESESGRISSIWGTLPDDLWVIGTHNNGDGFKHFNGERWTGHFINMCGHAYSIFGFATNDIWMGTYFDINCGNGIWHYDGGDWGFNYPIDQYDGSDFIGVYDINGNEYDDIYACGTLTFRIENTSYTRGIIWHYNGEEWSEFYRSDSCLYFYKIILAEDDIFVKSYGSYENDNRDYNMEFYQVVDSNIQRIYSNIKSEAKGIDIFTMNSKAYFVIGSSIYTYGMGEFQQLLSIDNNNFVYQANGRSENDIFLSMSDGIAHYNGENIEYLYQFSSDDMRIVGQPLLFENDIIYAVTANNCYGKVIHGTLITE